MTFRTLSQQTLLRPPSLLRQLPGVVAMMQTPDGHGRLELVKYHSPSTEGGDRHAPANTPGIRHVAFAVEDIDAVVAGLRARGAGLVGLLRRFEPVGGVGGRHADVDVPEPTDVTFV